MTSASRSLGTFSRFIVRMDLTTTEGGKTDDDDDDPITGVSAIKKDIASNEAVPPSPPGDELNAKGADCGEYVSVKQEEDEGEDYGR